MKCFTIILVIMAAVSACAMEGGKEELLFSDHFTEKPGEGWQWLRESPEDWRITDMGLELRARPGDAESVRNALLREAPELNESTLIFEVTITFTAELSEQYEQAGLVWYAEDKPVFKLVHERIDGELFIIPGKAAAPQHTVRLRLEVEKNKYRSFYRPEGETKFIAASEGELQVGAKNHISIQCYHGPTQGDHWIRFSDFTINAKPIK